MPISPDQVYSDGRPIVPDPAGQAFLADLTGGEGEDHGGGVRGIGTQKLIVATQKDHHAREGDALVAIDEGMVAGKAERVGRRERSHVRLVHSAID